MNYEKLLVLALQNNDAIYQSVAKTKEGYPLIAPLRNIEGTFPAIEFNQIAGGDVAFADDGIWLERDTFELVYYCEGDEYMFIKDEIEACVRAIGFGVMHRYIDRNPYTNVVHCSFHIRTVSSKAQFERLLEEQERLYKRKYPLSDTEQVPEGVYYDEKTHEELTITVVDSEDLIEMEE